MSHGVEVTRRKASERRGAAQRGGSSALTGESALRTQRGGFQVRVDPAQFPLLSSSPHSSTGRRDNSGSLVELGGDTVAICGVVYFGKKEQFAENDAHQQNISQWQTLGTGGHQRIS